MEIATTPIPLSDIASQFDPHLPRTPGYHVTDLIRAQERMVKGKAIEEEGEFVENGLMSWGRIWEASARPWLVEYCWALGFHFLPSQERVVDGLIGNLDGTTISRNSNYRNEQTFAVIETKATTGNPDPHTKPNWIAQVKAYCYMENTTLAWFLVLHAPRGGAPDYRCYLHQVQFTKEELSEHWQSLQGTRDYLEARRMEVGS